MSELITRSVGTRTRYLCLLAAVVSSLLLSGCSSDRQKELADYRDSMESVLENISRITAEISEIDPEADDVSETLLEKTDLLAEACRECAAVEPPEEYESVKEAASMLTEHMDLADEALHNAFTDEGCRSDYFDYAMEEYEMADHYLQYVLSFLRGEELTGDDITVEP